MTGLLACRRRGNSGAAWLFAFGCVLAAGATVFAQQAQRKGDGFLGPQRRVVALLKDVNTLKGKELNARWREILTIASGDSIASGELAQIALRRVPVEDDYQRYVAALYCAGYRTTTTHGPYPLAGNWRLRDYLNIMCDYRLPDRRSWHFSCDDSAADLRPDIPESKDGYTYFHEMLWLTLKKYGLDFKTDNAHVFRISKREKPPSGPVSKSSSPR